MVWAIQILLQSFVNPLEYHHWSPHDRGIIHFQSRNHTWEFSISWFSLSVCSIVLKWYTCSSILFEYTSISSMKTTTNWSTYGLNTLYVRSMKVAGALVNSINITRNSWWPYLVQNAVLETSASLIRNWWWPDLQSNLEKYYTPWSCSNKSSILERGYLFLTGTLFSSL